MGGSGVRFDWSRLSQQHLKHPWLLAGGLDATNVDAAMRTLRPWGVDVSSGIESSPGIKDHRKMRAFVDAVRASATPSPQPLSREGRGT
jgi:phosphoribosylanthranilate isomerase